MINRYYSKYYYFLFIWYIYILNNANNGEPRPLSPQKIDVFIVCCLKYVWNPEIIMPTG